VSWHASLSPHTHTHTDIYIHIYCLTLVKTHTHTHTRKHTPSAHGCCREDTRPLLFWAECVPQVRRQVVHHAGCWAEVEGLRHSVEGSVCVCVCVCGGDFKPTQPSNPRSVPFRVFRSSYLFGHGVDEPDVQVLLGADSCREMRNNPNLTNSV